jgi:hypothetical protein
MAAVETLGHVWLSVVGAVTPSLMVTVGLYQEATFSFGCVVDAEYLPQLSCTDFFVEYQFYYKCWCAGLRPPAICMKSSMANNA